MPSLVSNVSRNTSIQSPKIHAIVIAVSDYTTTDKPHELEELVQGADDICVALGTSITNAAEGIKFIRPTVYCSDAYIAIDRVLAKLTDNDIVIIYFAGHGQLNNDTLELLFSDDEILTTDELARLFANTRGKIVLILDCCHAGAIVRNEVILSLVEADQLSVV